MFHYVNLPRSKRNDRTYIADAIRWCEEKFGLNSSRWLKEDGRGGVRFCFSGNNDAELFRSMWG